MAERTHICRTLRTWSMSLETMGHVRFECPHPISEAELQDVLDLLVIIERQLRTSFAVRVVAEETSNG